MLRVWGVLALGLMVSGAAFAAEPTQPSPTIRVVAQATVAVKPDQAELHLGVATDKKTAAAAVAENEKKMEQVLASLKKEIGAEGEVKTAEISVQPRFNETRDGLLTSRVVGYTVTNMVRVRLANLKVVGRVLDAALQAGANKVERVEVTLKDPEAAQNQALRGASAKARVRATAMAEGQGLRVGDVLSVSEGEVSVPFAPLEGGALYKRAANIVAMSVEPGAVEVSATVTVIFALKAR